MCIRDSSTGSYPRFSLPTDSSPGFASAARDSSRPVKARFRSGSLSVGFIFKITANIDPNHRSCVAFCKICSGKFVRNAPYTPVSYTHLDVYKRQKLTFEFRHESEFNRLHLIVFKTCFCATVHRLFAVEQVRRRIPYVTQMCIRDSVFPTREYNRRRYS